MTTGKSDFKPLEFDAESGRWQWPPTYADTKQPNPYKTTVDAMDDVLWTLVHNGEITDKTGHAVTKITALLANPDVPVGRRKQAIIDLEKLGLVERAMGPHQTYRIALAIPVSQVPGTDPHKPRLTAKLDEAKAEYETEFGPLAAEWPPYEEVPKPSQEALDVQRLAVALLDEVVKRASAEESPGWHADRDHLAKQLEKANHRIVGLTKENEIAAGTIKALRSDAGEARRTIEGLEANLETAIRSARDLARQAGITPSQETQSALFKLMTRIPGYDKGAE